jgi:hypothetical protein
VYPTQFTKKERFVMATATSATSAAQIGETAGLVWHALEKKGPQSLAKLSKQVDAPRENILLALGWLAREDKLEIDENSRGKVFSLRENGV